jgi:hypothetical protein
VVFWISVLATLLPSSQSRPAENEFKMMLKGEATCTSKLRPKSGVFKEMHAKNSGRLIIPAWLTLRPAKHCGNSALMFWHSGKG